MKQHKIKKTYVNIDSNISFVRPCNDVLALDSESNSVMLLTTQSTNSVLHLSTHQSGMRLIAVGTFSNPAAALLCSVQENSILYLMLHKYESV